MSSDAFKYILRFTIQPGYFEEQRLIKELPKDWAAGNGIDMGGFPFFTVNMEWLPAPVLAEFIEEPLLGIQ